MSERSSGSIPHQREFNDFTMAERHGDRIRPFHVFHRRRKIRMGDLLFAADGIDEFFLDPPNALLRFRYLHIFQALVSTLPSRQCRLTARRLIKAKRSFRAEDVNVDRIRREAGDRGHIEAHLSAQFQLACDIDMIRDGRSLSPSARPGDDL